MDRTFNPDRLKIARLRRKMTYKSLAERIGMTPKMVSLYENEGEKHTPTDEALKKVAKALGYPVPFFFGESIEALDDNTVSFRSLKSMRASQQHAAISAGRIGFLVADFLAGHFTLPEPDLPDLRNEDPEMAAETIRELWGLGNKSIKNMIHLLESRGIKVFSLAENTADVDAFSFWKDGTPFVFLNTQKSGERSRFDAAHELGHLVLHKHGAPTGKAVEAEADAFASALLMPRSSVIESLPDFVTINSLITLKKNWLVSLIALIVRMNKLSLLTEWQYRTLTMEASQQGYRKCEPEPISRERSLIFSKVIPALKGEGIDISKMAKILTLPVDEVANLFFMPALHTNTETVNASSDKKANLRLVK